MICLYMDKKGFGEWKTSEMTYWLEHIVWTVLRGGFHVCMGDIRKWGLMQFLWIEPGFHADGCKLTQHNFTRHALWKFPSCNVQIATTIYFGSTLLFLSPSMRIDRTKLSFYCSNAHRMNARHRMVEICTVPCYLYSCFNYCLLFYNLPIPNDLTEMFVQNVFPKGLQVGLIVDDNELACFRGV